MISARPIQVRLGEAHFFLERFVEACSPPASGGVSPVAYGDAFLWALVSCEDLVSEHKRNTLRSSHAFCLLKALRNLTVHRSVILALRQRGGARKPFVRSVTYTVGGPPRGQLIYQLRIDRVRQCFNNLLRRERNSNKKRHARSVRAVREARCYLSALKKAGRDSVPLQDVFREGLEAVQRITGASPINALDTGAIRCDSVTLAPQRRSES